MNKITYIGDNNTTNFVFDFPFFTHNDIKVEQNGILLNSGYTIQHIESANPADIPYSGGTIVFDKAPINTDIITIYRDLGFTRVVDYQPTQKIDPETLNQDFCFITELLKDIKNQLTDFDTKYKQLTSISETTHLINKLEQTQNNINKLGDIDTLARTSDISALQNATSFTSTGKNTLAKMALPAGTAVDINFLDTPAGQYRYVAEYSGLLTLVIKSSVEQDFACIVSSKTILVETLPAGKTRTLMIPIKAGASISCQLASPLSVITYQRMLPYSGTV